MSCLTCNKLLHHHMCKLCNISKPFPPLWHMLLTHMYLWTNYLCISHKTQLVHLSCHSITKTKQGPFTGPTYRPPGPLGDSSMSFWSILPPPPRMHLSHTSSQFNPRAYVGTPRLYKETPAPLKSSSYQVIWRSSHPEPKTLIPQSSSSSRALAS
jgi:hypothetical protein